MALGAAVSRIDHGGRAIRLETTRGAVTARRVIVTVPTSILAAEVLRFDPPLPDKLAAAAGLPLGVDDKLFIALTGPLPGIEPDMFLVGSTNSRETMTYQVRPLDRPAIYTFSAGGSRRRSSGKGEGAMFSFATGELARLLGNDIRRKIAPLASTAWLQDPWARGSYSYALPGQPRTARCSPPRSTTASSSPAKPRRPISSRPRTAPISPASPPPILCSPSLHRSGSAAPHHLAAR